MKVDGLRRGVGDVITLPGAVTNLLAAETAEHEHERAAVKLRFESRRLAKLAVPALVGAVGDATRAVEAAKRDLAISEAELSRVQALADGET